MSATPNALRDPRLLPGASAFGITRAYFFVYLLGVLLWAPFAILLLVSDNDSRPPAIGWLFGAVFGVLGVGIVVGIVGRLRNLKERGAGYTTLLNNPLDRDLLDRHTGQVLWRAGDPAPRTPGILGIIRGDQGGSNKARGAGESAFPAPSPVSKILPFLPFAGSIVVVIVGLSIARTKTPPVEFVLIYLGFGAFGALVLGIVVLVTRLTLGRRTRAIAALRPDAMIFTSTRTRNFANAAKELGSSTSTSGRFPVVATDAGLEFWGSTGSDPWMSVSWNDIVSVDPGSVAYGRTTFRAITLAVEHGDRKVPVTLALYGRQGSFNAPAPWANQIFDEIQFHVMKR